MKKEHCHACRKEVTGAPRRCPHCGAPNPTFEYNVTKPIVIGVAVVILLCAIADVLHNRSPEYVAGQTYPIAKSGLVCLTLDDLTKAKAAMSDEAEQLGCLMLASDEQPQVKVLDTNATAVKVLVLAPNPPLKDFQGWTAADNLNPKSVAAP
jgi:hypothetical protein